MPVASMLSEQSTTTLSARGRPAPIHLPSERMKCNKPGWLENITSHLRSPTSPSRDRESMVSNPELLLHGLAKPNSNLGHGAEVIQSPSSAFEGGKEELITCVEQAQGQSEPALHPDLSHWKAETGSCCSEPGTYDVHRIKLPPRTSSRQGHHPLLTTKAHKEDQPLPPTPPADPPSLISAFSDDGPPSPRSVSGFSCTTASASGSACSSKSRLQHKREKPIVAPPPVITSIPIAPADAVAARFNRPTSPLPAASPVSPFRALLLRPIQPDLPFVADEARLVTLLVGGQRFTSTQATITSKPSKLTDFLRGLTMTGADEPKEDDQLVEDEVADMNAAYVEGPAERPRLISISPMPSPNVVPGQHLQPAIVEPDAADLPMSAHATLFCVESEVPASISSEEDWSADYEVSPMPTTTFNHLLQERNSQAYSTPSCPPSLSTGSTNASTDDEGEREGEAVASPSPVSPTSEHSRRSGTRRRPADQAIEIFLERDPEPFPAVLRWLRTGQLPRQYNLSSTLDLFAEKQADGSLELRQATTIPTAQLALSLHPLLASLQNLKEEAQWLGLKDLKEECEDRINELAAWLRHGSKYSSTSTSYAYSSTQEGDYSEAPPTARPTSHRFKNSRRPRQARFYGSAPPLPLPEATPEEHRQNWI